MARGMKSWNSPEQSIFPTFLRPVGQAAPGGFMTQGRRGEGFEVFPGDRSWESGGCESWRCIPPYRATSDQANFSDFGIKSGKLGPGILDSKWFRQVF